MRFATLLRGPDPGSRGTECNVQSPPNAVDLFDHPAALARYVNLLWVRDNTSTRHKAVWRDLGQPLNRQSVRRFNLSFGSQVKTACWQFSQNQIYLISTKTKNACHFFSHFEKVVQNPCTPCEWVLFENPTHAKIVLVQVAITKQMKCKLIAGWLLVEN